MGDYSYRFGSSLDPKENSSNGAKSHHFGGQLKLPFPEITNVPCLNDSITLILAF